MENEKSLLKQVALTEEKNLLTLVEHRQKFDLEDAQLNIFETHTKAEKVNLTFDDLVLTSMLRGKKVMHLRSKSSFEYLPGESVIVPGDETMKIDFPDACPNNPTQCLALVISKDQLSQTLDVLNHKYPRKLVEDDWGVDSNYFHLPNNYLLASAIDQLVNISLYDNSAEKGLLAKLKVEEVVIRLMQTQARMILEYQYKCVAENPLMVVVSYIKEHLQENIDIETISKKACMSKATFYRKFSNEFGITPQVFIQRERFKKAKNLLENKHLSVATVAYSVGFNNVGHFSTFFKNMAGVSPSVYQLDCAVW